MPELIAMTAAEGKLLTIAIVVALVLILGVIVITTDTNWFD